MSRIVVVHDVLGTLFSLTAPIRELESIFADQFKDENAPPILAELIIMVSCNVHDWSVLFVPVKEKKEKGRKRGKDHLSLKEFIKEQIWLTNVPLFSNKPFELQDWYHATQRDFTTLSINGNYLPIGTVFKSTLPRILLQAGLIPPDQYNKDKSNDKFTTLAKAGSGIQPVPGNQDPFPESVKDRIMASLGKLEPRPGMVEAFSKTYRDEQLVPKHVKQVELWGATNGGLALGEKLFKGALGGDTEVFIGDDGVGEKQVMRNTLGKGVGLFSCDEIKIAKPEPKVYEAIQNRIKTNSSSSSFSSWFVASHTWDLFAAKKAGFKTAWVGYEEFFTCPEIYQKPDIIANDLEEAARKILEWEGKEGQ